MYLKRFGCMFVKIIYKFYIVLTTVIQAESLPELCPKVKVGDTWYDKETFWSNLGRPYTMTVHRTTNILFFSYSLLESYSDMDFQLAFYNLDTNEFQTIEGIKGGCSVAIDQLYDEIYLGGSDGIYKFNMITKFADFYQEKGKNIWSLFFKKNLFYVSYPDQKLYMEYEGNFVKVKEFEDIEIDQFHVNSNGDIYYANKTGFYKYDKESLHTVVIFDLVTVRQIAEDNNQVTYVCTNIGVFVEGSNNNFTKVLDIKNIHGLAFDTDNVMIYSDEKNIVKLKYSFVGCDTGNLTLYEYAINNNN